MKARRPPGATTRSSAWRRASTSSSPGRARTSILTVLGEFGPAQATGHPASHGNHGGTAGPAHNTIPEPDRSEDNSSIWTGDFSEAYYEDLLFSEAKGDVSMRNMYIEMSSGRYTVNGDVSDWVGVPFNAAAYGSNYCGDIVCADTWRFVNDAADAFADTFADTDALNDYLADFDIWDRYDYDGDGNFDESDGYIDHYQAVHAGPGEEAGGGALGEDAIWSHRWYAWQAANGPDGTGSDIAEFGGLRIGDSDYWIGDYTVEPEDGGVGVFAHEFAHDLNLPDLYDTSGNTGGAENSTGFWTLMSSGSNNGTGRPEDGIGGHPVHMGNWEKFQLGWLNYEVAVAGAPSSHRLGPASHNTKQAQGVFVVLPDNIVPLDLGAPFEGTSYYYSGSGDNLDVSMTKSITLPAGAPSLSAQVRYEIETDWDYAYLTVNGDSVATSRSTNTSPNGQNFGNGITGDSGGWVGLDRGPVGLRRPDRGHRLPVLDGRRRRRVRLPGRRDRDHGSAVRRRRGRRRAGPSTASARRRAPRSRRSSTPTSWRTASTRATTVACGTASTTSGGSRPCPTSSSSSRTRTGS